MPPLLGVTKNDGKKKSLILKLYDFIKAGTDIIDQRMSLYSVTSKSSKWTICAFFYMLDVVRVNASIVVLLDKGLSPEQKILLILLN